VALRLAFTADGWRDALRSAAEHGGIMGRLEGAERPALYAPVTVTIVVDGAAIGTVTPTGDLALAVVAAKLPSNEPRAAAAPGAGAQQAAGADAPLFKQFESLSRPEKMHWAKFGSESQRRQILRDRDASLHPLVLQNAQLSGRELAQLLSSGSVSGQFVVAVAERDSLHRDPAVVLALVQNPVTPVHVAERLVARLPLETAKRLAKSGALRLPVLSAAKKRAAEQR
jgi:hypothetical protein